MTTYKPLSSTDWRFITENLPRYSSRDDVLMCDILLRFIEGEDVAQDDLEMIADAYNSDKQEVSKALQELETRLMNEARANSKTTR